MSTTLPDSASIRRFLKHRFNDEEFSAFSFDYFRDVYQEYTIGMARSAKIQMLLEHCQRQDRLPELVAALERELPELYRKDLATTRRVETPSARTPSKRNPRQIFISHAHEDREFARRLATDLEQRGWLIWIAPDSIRPGEKWVEAINRGLSESGIVTLVLTPEAVKSSWVNSETSAAISLEHRREASFIPLELSPAPVPPLWDAYQYISFRQDYDTGLKDLLAELNRVAGPPAVPKPQAPVAEPPPEPVKEQHPSLALRLSVKPQTIDVGDEATWTVTLKNDGDADLMVVIRRQERILLDEPFALAAGKGRRFTFTTSHDKRGTWTESVTATGISSEGATVLEQSSESVKVQQPRKRVVETKPKPAAQTPSRTVSRPAEPKKKELAAIVVDDGAIRAMRRGASLLPVGVLRTSGSFAQGATIDLLTSKGEKFAEGVTSYSSAEINRIKGHQSSEISQILGVHHGDAVVTHGKIAFSGSRPAAVRSTPKTKQSTFPENGIVVDDGAIKAIKRGASLLPVGVLQTTGDFPRDATIALLNRLGGQFAEGVTKYSAAEIERIKGRQSSEIYQLIGDHRGAAVVPHNKISLIGARLLSLARPTLASSQSAGVVVGDGAILALQRGASLLPVGVLQTVGSFREGATIAILDRQGRRIASGVSSYSSAEIERIKGQHSSQIRPILGFDRGDPIVPHRKLTLE